MKILAVLFFTFNTILAFGQDTLAVDTTRNFDLTRIQRKSYRGLTIKSFNDVDPLYVVDGHVMTVEEFETIDAGKIQSISVVKDGNEKIYGERARYGVIVIKMKEGQFTPKKE